MSRRLKIGLTWTVLGLVIIFLAFRIYSGSQSDASEGTSDQTVATDKTTLSETLPAPEQPIKNDEPSAVTSDSPAVTIPSDAPALNVPKKDIERSARIAISLYLSLKSDDERKENLTQLGEYVTPELLEKLNSIWSNSHDLGITTTIDNIRFSDPFVIVKSANEFLVEANVEETVEFPSGARTFYPVVVLTFHHNNGAWVVADILEIGVDSPS